MSLSRVDVRNPVETPAQLIKQCVDWLKSHPPGTAENAPASIGFMMAQNIPIDFGPDIVVASAGSGLQPEIIYHRETSRLAAGQAWLGTALPGPAGMASVRRSRFLSGSMRGALCG
jgi:hypothetical protein